jgi:hypothetical protein
VVVGIHRIPTKIRDGGRQQETLIKLAMMVGIEE